MNCRWVKKIKTKIQGKKRKGEGRNCMKKTGKTEKGVKNTSLWAIQILPVSCTLQPYTPRKEKKYIPLK